MFDELEIHKRCEATTFAELLMGYSPHCMMPPTESDPIMQIVRTSYLYPEVREATTEMTHGAGIDAEYGQGVRYA